MDCFVSCFRINPHNNQHFKVTAAAEGPGAVPGGPGPHGVCPLQVCLASSSPSTFHFVLVNSLHRIITNVSVRGSSVLGRPAVSHLCLTCVCCPLSPTWTGGQRSTRSTATPESFASCSQTRSAESSKARAHTRRCAPRR